MVLLVYPFKMWIKDSKIVGFINIFCAICIFVYQETQASVRVQAKVEVGYLGRVGKRCWWWSVIDESQLAGAEARNFRVASLMKPQGQSGEGGPSLDRCGVDWPARKPGNLICLWEKSRSNFRCDSRSCLPIRGDEWSATLFIWMIV